MVIWDCSRVHCVFPTHIICSLDDANHIYEISKRISKTLGVSRNGLAPNLDEKYFVVYRSKPRFLTNNEIRLYKKECLFLENEYRTDLSKYRFMSVLNASDDAKEKKKKATYHKQLVPMWELRCSDWQEEKVLRIFYSGMAALFLANNYCGIYHGDTGSESSWMYFPKENRLLLSSFFNSEYSTDEKLFLSDVTSFSKFFVRFFSASMSHDVRAAIRKDPVRFATSRFVSFSKYLSASYKDPFVEKERKERLRKALHNVKISTRNKYEDGDLHHEQPVDSIPYVGPYFKERFEKKYGVRTIGNLLSLFQKYHYDKRLLRKMLINKDGRSTNEFAYQSVKELLSLYIAQDLSESDGSASSYSYSSSTSSYSQHSFK